MMPYTFRYTEENGYKQVFMSKKDHNSLFEYRQVKWNYKYEYLLNEETGHFVMLRLASLPAKLLVTISYPLIVILHGLVNYKEVNREIQMIWSQKKNGSFSADDWYRHQVFWDELMRAVRK
ncbi:hypothetical protein MW332_004738 [Vibrio parahaemolyticus]|nr:hypothetical protein [Vibrio parahaemolyticus]